MGNSAAKKQRNQVVSQSQNVLSGQLANAFQPTQGQTLSGNFANTAFGNYQNAVAQNTADYGNIMGQYHQLYGDVYNSKPTNFNFERVNTDRPAELGESYGYLREAAPGYRDFAATGGYSDKDIQELRARGISPIRAAYGNTIRELERANTLGGGASNYIAARSRAQREMPQQISDAMTGVNAELANSIRSGKLAGLAGLTGIGGTMGGLSSAEAGRQLQANITNSQGGLQAEGMSEQARQARIAQLLGISSGQTGLYGTTPGLSSTFGNQVVGGLGALNSATASNNAFGLGLINSGLGVQPQGTPWWQTALQVAGTAAPYVALAASDKNLKKDIHHIDEEKVRKGIKKLNLSTWKYKGDNTSHMGPMAQDVKKHLGIGDGKTLHLVDIMGVMLATAKGGA